MVRAGPGQEGLCSQQAIKTTQNITGTHLVSTNDISEVRCHLTQNTEVSAAVPSNFSCVT